MNRNSDPSSNIQILAIEDDPIYAESLELLFSELGYTQFHIVDNAADAIKLFRQEKPDILLVDIEINGPIDGIELVQILSEVQPVPVVYVTAFSDNEIFQKAKSTRPSAYVVKPYRAVTLQAAIELALFNRAGKSHNAGVTEEKDGLIHLDGNFIFIKCNSRLLKIRVDEILYIEVDEKYCFIHTADRKYTVNTRLKNLLTQLSNDLFMQVHRAFAIRLDAIDQVNLEENTIKISAREIPIGKTFRDAFFNKLKII
jgi:DNA-binding LytR/AlgR family response regulator